MPFSPPVFEVYQGDMREVLATFAQDSVDSFVCDPPYGLSFMSKGWDRGVPGVEFWREALRVAKPGAHLLAFGGTRTHHRLMCAIEDAGWEIRDCIMWVYGSGFPKSHNIGKAMDKAAGAEREVVGVVERPSYDGATRTTPGVSSTEGYGSIAGERFYPDTAPATDAARQWQGWGTALKPAWEPIIVARKPLEGTVAKNVLKHGTGGINVDGCRIEGIPPSVPQPRLRPDGNDSGHALGSGEGRNGAMSQAAGRWPANLIHDGSDEVVGLFPQTAPARRNVVSDGRAVPFMQAGDSATGGTSGRHDPSNSHDDNGGSAARFFYCAKTSKKDRGEGNNHPTVKPTDLMRYLVKLVTPPGGTVLDPFMGSGSTGKAALLEGMNFIGVDLDPEHVATATKRLSAAQSEFLTISPDSPC